MTSSAEKFKPSERKCIVTGQILSKSELVRFVLSPLSLHVLGCDDAYIVVVVVVVVVGVSVGVSVSVYISVSV